MVFGFEWTFVCLLIWQALQMLSFSNLFLGKPTTGSWLDILFSNSIFAWPRRLCDSQLYVTYDVLKCKTFN